MTIDRSQLFPGEKIIWAGQPYSGLILRPIELLLIPFSLFWGGFAIFWNVGVWRMDNDDLSFRLFGLPFVMTGIYVTIGRFLIDMQIRKRMQYLVTNQRILIIREGLWSRTKSLDVSRLPTLELEERKDGSGTIRFGSAGGWFSNNNFGIWQPALDPTPQFLRVPNVRRVYEMIQTASGT